MVGKNAKDFFLSKIIFPNILITDQPGVIISKTTRKYGRAVSKKRIIYLFEDVCVSLQLEMLKVLGEKRTSEFYYRVGKNIGAYYLVLANTKPPSAFLLKPILEYIFSSLNSVGHSIAKEVIFHPKKLELILRGRDNIISRKTGDLSIFAGFASGILSYLSGENIEAEVISCCKKEGVCEIRCSPSISKKYEVDYSSFDFLMKDYSLNFPRLITSRGKLPSYRDFVKFKKIEIHKDGKQSIIGHTIIFTEVGFMGLIVKHHLDEGYSKILEEGIEFGVRELAQSLFGHIEDKEDRIRFLTSLLSVLGWGILNLKIKDKKIIINLVNSPSNKYCILYEAIVIKGYLNCIFNKKFKIEKLETKYNPVVIEITYS